MKKKILLVVSMLAILMVLLAISVSAKELVETWDISGSGNVTAYLYADLENSGEYSLSIVGEGEMMNWSNEKETPWFYRVSFSEITSITIENGVTNIGDMAFRQCSGITSIEIPSSVTSIGYMAFFECNSLRSIDIPYGVTNIGDYAFAYCSNLDDVVIPDSVTWIGSCAFYECYNLQNVVLPKYIRYIESETFYACNT